MLQLGPPFILVFAYLGAALIVAEVALPSFGLLGLTGFASSGLAFANAVHQGRAAWPLAVPLLVAAVLGLLLMRGKVTVTAELSSAAALAIAGVAWGTMNDSPAAVATGIALAVATPFGFRRLHAATRMLLDGPEQTGMDALVGRAATLVAWDQHSKTGSVRVDGSLWNAQPAPGETIDPANAYEVIGHDRLTLLIRHREAT